jgi:hypothetical protein
LQGERGVARRDRHRGRATRRARGTPPGDEHEPADPPSLVALLAARDERRRTTGYAASDFLAGALSDFFDESDFDVSDFDESFDSFFSPPSFDDRSISRLRFFVP